MDLEIGSTLYRNTDGTVEIEGVPQMTLGLKKPDGPVLLSFVQFDTVGRVVVKVVDSTFAFNERRAHELARTQTGLVLRNSETGKTVLDVQMKSPGRLAIKQGEFVTMKGHTMEISPSEWKVDKHQMKGGENDAKGGSVKLG